MISARKVYPTSEGISLYSFQGKPITPIRPVKLIHKIQIGIKYFHFGSSNLYDRLTYNSANFMPRQNSHKYCRKKLFHTRSSLYPSKPTKEDHSKLIRRGFQYPPTRFYNSDNQRPCNIKLNNCRNKPHLSSH